MSFSCACNEGKVRSNLFYNVDLNGYFIPPTTPYLGSIEGAFSPFLTEEISFFLLMHFLANLRVYLKMILFSLKIKIILSPLLSLFIIHKMNSIFSNCLWLMSFDDEILLLVELSIQYIFSCLPENIIFFGALKLYAKCQYCCFQLKKKGVVCVFV